MELERAEGEYSRKRKREEEDEESEESRASDVDIKKEEYEEDSKGSSSDEEERELWRQQAEQSRRLKRKLAAKNAGVEGLSESSEEDEYFGEKESSMGEQLEHGEKLEPFNLNEEISDRVINVEKGSVNTVLGKDMDEAWLQDYEQNIKENRQFAHKMAVLQQKITETAPVQEPEKLSHMQKLKLLEEISEPLLWGETVGAALNRLRPPHVKKGKGKESQENSTFHSLAEKADTIMSQLGIHTIYELSKEDLLDKLDQVKQQLVKWVYKWEGNDQVFGPFAISEMTNWNTAGYFAKTEGGPGLLARQLVGGKPTTDFMPFETVDLDNIYG